MMVWINAMAAIAGLLTAFCGLLRGSLSTVVFGLGLTAINLWLFDMNRRD